MYVRAANVVPGQVDVSTSAINVALRFYANQGRVDAIEARSKAASPLNTSVLLGAFLTGK